MEQGEKGPSSRRATIGRWIGVAFLVGVVVQIFRAANGNAEAQAILVGGGRGLMTSLLVVAITVALLGLPRLFGRSYKPGLLAFVIVGSIVMGMVKLLLPAALGTKAVQTAVAQPVATQVTQATQGQGWTEESTGDSYVDPFSEVPAGTRYYRDAKGIVFKLYPPGAMPNAPPANPFGVMDSHEWGAPESVEGASPPPPGFVVEDPPPPAGFVIETAPVPANTSLDDFDPFAGSSGSQSAPVAPCPVGFHSNGSSCWKDCPGGYHAVAANSDECTEDIKPIVERGFFGGCPTGYVDHPTNPKQCVLPAVAERFYRNRRSS